MLQASGSQAGPGMDACIIYEAAVDQVEEGGGGCRIWSMVGGEGLGGVGWHTGGKGGEEERVTYIYIFFK